jgi:hypothetical protein
MANELDSPPVPAATPTGEASITGLVTGIVNDAQTLMKQELQLVKEEIKQELRKTRDAAFALAIGAVLALWGVFFLSFMLVHLIDWSSEQIPLWGAFGIVGALLVVVGAVFIFIGKNRAEDVNLVPDQTVESMKENVQWLKNPR